MRMVPLEVVEGVEVPSAEEALPLYDFEPSRTRGARRAPAAVHRGRIYAALLQSAASELAARQRAMNTATTNAEDLIRTYTRLANTARQSEITQEISEIVSGADALASGENSSMRRHRADEPAKRDRRDCHRPRAPAHAERAPSVGRVARVIGPVVDIEFPPDAIPEIYNALKTDDRPLRPGRGR